MRAFLSVYDKTGVVELATGLADAGWDLISSGGTAAALRDAGLTVTDTETYTGTPAILGHRVMTLHPKIHGGILADPTDPAHQADMAEHGIDPIDLVVANLYPFGADPATFTHGGNAGAVDLIDIGGPAMIRAAAKNHAHVGVLVDPSDYPKVLEVVRADGGLPPQLRLELARKAFATTAAYDAAIVEWFDGEGASPADELPPTFHLALERAEVTRYGENPHQRGARYRRAGTTSWWDAIEQHSGLALSYLNIYDSDAAWRCVHDLGDEPAAVIVKHANPCGVAVGGSLADAYQRAYECDSRSAFGGIVAVNRPVDAATVERIRRRRRGHLGELDPPEAGLQPVRERPRNGPDDLEDIQAGRQRGVEGHPHRLGVHALDHRDLEVLGLTRGPRRRPVGVGDPRVGVEARRVGHRYGRPAQRPLQAPREVPGRGEPQAATLGIAHPEPLDRWRGRWSVRRARASHGPQRMATATFSAKPVSPYGAGRCRAAGAPGHG